MRVYVCMYVKRLQILIYNAPSPPRLLRSHHAFVEELLTALSTIAAPSASTLTKNVHKFLRVPALGAAMAESAVKKKIKKFV